MDIVILVALVASILGAGGAGLMIGLNMADRDPAPQGGGFTVPFGGIR